MRRVKADPQCKLCVYKQEAEAAERGADPMLATCRAIVETVIDKGIESADRKRTWKGDAADALRRGTLPAALPTLIAVPLSNLSGHLRACRASNVRSVCCTKTACLSCEGDHMPLIAGVSGRCSQLEMCWLS